MNSKSNSTKVTILSFAIVSWKPLNRRRSQNRTTVTKPSYDVDTMTARLQAVSQIEERLLPSSHAHQQAGSEGGEDCETTSHYDDYKQNYVLHRNIEARITPKVKERLRKQLKCHVCDLDLSKTDRHVDHDHMTGTVSFSINHPNFKACFNSSIYVNIV